VVAAVFAKIVAIFVALAMLI